MESLPHVVMFKIFNHLDEESKLAASHACQAWNDAYRHFRYQRKFDYSRSRLYIVIITSNYCSYRNTRKQLRHIVTDMRRGTKHVHHFTLDLNLSKRAAHRHHMVCKDTVIKVLKYLRSNHAKLITFNLRHLNLAYYPTNKVWGIIWELCLLFYKSSTLVNVSLRGALMAANNARSTLRSLTTAADTLRHLDIVDCVLEQPTRHGRIFTTNLHILLPKFTELRRLQINFTWLSPRLLAALSQSCAALEFLDLEVFVGRAHQYSNLTPAHWQAAYQLLPTLQLEVIFIEGNASKDEVQAALTALLPHLPAGTGI